MGNISNKHFLLSHTQGKALNSSFLQILVMNRNTSQTFVTPQNFQSNACPKTSKFITSWCKDSEQGEAVSVGTQQPYGLNRRKKLCSTVHYWIAMQCEMSSPPMELTSWRRHKRPPNKIWSHQDGAWDRLTRVVHWITVRMAHVVCPANCSMKFPWRIRANTNIAHETMNVPCTCMGWRHVIILIQLPGCATSMINVDRISLVKLLLYMSCILIIGLFRMLAW